MSLLLLLDDDPGATTSTGNTLSGWGTAAWGTSPWGAGSLPPPSIIGVSTPHGVHAGAGVVDRRGGDVITIIGNNFSDPMIVELLLGGIVQGQCYISRPRYDIKPNRVYAGTPELDFGTYDLRVETAGGSSVIFPNAVTYERFSNEMKAETVRKNMSDAWKSAQKVIP